MGPAGPPHSNHQLRQARIARNWRQHDLADLLGTTVVTVSRWERGIQHPSAYFRVKLSAIFRKSAEQLGLVAANTPLSEARGPDEEVPLEASIPSAFPQIWNVPYSRNPLFTGRGEILHHLHERLNQPHRVELTQSWALTGLGGIGKTQIALEYAHAYRQEYRFIFWANAATQETLSGDILAIANLLQLPERNEQDQKRRLQAVKRWFATHQEWLWILDNADEVTAVQDVMPPGGSGHLLLTSRAQAWGSLAQQIEVTTLGKVEASLFLLRRAKRLAPDAFLSQVSKDQLSAAETVALELGFLPLALDQAGAYIEEVGCSLLAYLELYRAHRQALLLRRGHVPTNHPEPVATTWSLSFQKIEQANSAAADLLRVCAFLEPDTIPEEVFTEGGQHLGGVLQGVATNAVLLNEAIEILRTFSLVQRHAETRILSIHHLVQAVLKDSMEREIQSHWAEHVVRAINAVFPQRIEMATWPCCQRLLAQVQTSSMLIRDYTFTFEEAISLLFRAALFLQDTACYEQAEPLHQQVLDMREQLPGPDYLDIAISLSHLADLAYYQGKGELAETLFQRALHLQEENLGPEHPDVANTLVGLARLFTVQSKYEQAELLFQRAIPLLERALGPEHLDVANALLRLVRLYDLQGKYQQAEPLSWRALHIRIQALGPDHPDVAFALLRQGSLFAGLEKYEQAEPLYQQALLINERVLGPDHPNVASVLNNLAVLFQEQGKYEQSEVLYQRALQNWERAFGPDHGNIAFALTNLALLFSLQSKYEQAEPLYWRALAINEQQWGSEHVEVATVLHGLANLYREQGQYEQAGPLYRQALHIRKRLLGPENLDVAETQHDLATFLEKQGRWDEAASFLEQALSIRTQLLGEAHTQTIATRTQYAWVTRVRERADC